MTREEVLELMDRFSAGSLYRMEYAQGDIRLVLEKAPCSAPAPQPAAIPAAAAVSVLTEPETEGTTVRSPLVGTFYAAPGPEAAAFVKVGDRVKKNDTVCIIEAMKMMSEVPAPCDCEILEVLAASGDLVGFDQPLFRIREL